MTAFLTWKMIFVTITNSDMAVDGVEEVKCPYYSLILENNNIEFLNEFSYKL